jgi:hypothetical protein
MVAGYWESPPKLVPPLAALLELWRQCYGTQALPARSRLDAAALERWKRHIAWIEATGNEQFLVGSFGIELIRRFGREATNNLVDDLAFDIATSLCEKLLKAVATAAPVIGRATVQLGHHAANFSELALPLAGEAGRVTRLLFAAYELTSSRDG